MARLALPTGNVVPYLHPFFERLEPIETPEGMQQVDIRIKDTVSPGSDDRLRSSTLARAAICITLMTATVAAAGQVAHAQGYTGRAPAVIEDDPGAKYSIAGDSLTVGSLGAGKLAAKSMAQGVELIGSEAKVGVSASYGVKELNDMSEAVVQSDVVVIALGTNPSSNFEEELLSDVRTAHEIGGTDGRAPLIAIPELLGDNKKVNAAGRNPIIYTVAERAKAEGIDVVVLPYYEFGKTIKLNDGYHPADYNQFTDHTVEVLTQIILDKHRQLYPDSAAAAAAAATQTPGQGAGADAGKAAPEVPGAGVNAGPSDESKNSPPAASKKAAMSTMKLGRELPTMTTALHDVSTGSAVPKIKINGPRFKLSDDAAPAAAATGTGAGSTGNTNTGIAPPVKIQMTGPKFMQSGNQDLPSIEEVTKNDPPVVVPKITRADDGTVTGTVPPGQEVQGGTGSTTAGGAAAGGTASGGTTTTSPPPAAGEKPGETTTTAARLTPKGYAVPENTTGRSNAEFLVLFDGPMYISGNSGYGATRKSSKDDPNNPGQKKTYLHSGIDFTQHHPDGWTDLLSPVNGIVESVDFDTNSNHPDAGVNIVIATYIDPAILAAQGITDTDGIVYIHMRELSPNSIPENLQPGTLLEPGQVIGGFGKNTVTGASDGPHVHMSVYAEDPSTDKRGMVTTVTEGYTEDPGLFGFRTMGGMVVKIDNETVIITDTPTEQAQDQAGQAAGGTQGGDAGNTGSDGASSPAIKIHMTGPSLKFGSSLEPIDSVTGKDKPKTSSGDSARSGTDTTNPGTTTGGTTPADGQNGGKDNGKNNDKNGQDGAGNNQGGTGQGGSTTTTQPPGGQENNSGTPAGGGQDGGGSTENGAGNGQDGDSGQDGGAPPTTPPEQGGSDQNNAPNPNSLRGDTIPEKIKNFYIDNGFTEAGTYGIMGSYAIEGLFQPSMPQIGFQHKKKCEATPPERLDPGTKENPGPTRGLGFGEAQWTSEGRQIGLQNYADSQGTSWKDLKTQLEFSLIELQGRPGLLNTVTTTNDITFAAGEWVEIFERPWQWDTKHGGSVEEQIKEKAHRARVAWEIKAKFDSGDMASIEVACLGLPGYA